MTALREHSIEKRIQELKALKLRRESGKFNLIPFYEHLPRFSEQVPGFIPGVMYKILSQSGIGKTKLVKFLTIIMPFYYFKVFGEKFHTIYFALEESENEFIDSLIVMLLKIKYNIRTDTLALSSYYKHALSDELLVKIEACSKDVQDILNHVTIIDNVYNPTGCYKACREISKLKGTHIYRNVEINGKTEKIYSHYKANDPEERILVVADHVGLMTPESGKSLHQTMSMWSMDYCKKQISKHWGWIVVNVQQLMAAGEDVEHFKNNKLEPSLDKAADNKIVIRDDYVVLGLFAPVRYEITKHLGYDVTKLLDNYRCLSVLKNRLGRPGLKIGLYFDGATNEFSELPLPDSLSMPKVYQDILDNNKKKKS